MGEVFFVTCDHRVHARQVGRPLYDRILKITDPAFNRSVDDSSINQRDIEESEEPGNMPSCISAGEGMGEKIIERCYGCGAEKSLHLPLFDKLEDAGGAGRMRPPIQENIQHDIRVDQDSHRYLSRRYRS